MACGCTHTAQLRAHPPTRTRPSIDLRALSLLLNDEVVQALDDAPPPAAPRATGRPTANVWVLWQYYTKSVYRSGDLPVLAVREALQNSVDAIRTAERTGELRVGDGLFQVWYEGSTLTLQDNGIGMSQDDILTKFLSLGTTGKTGTGSAALAGGFGVAKAVILGTAKYFKWQMWTRDNHVVSSGEEKDIEIFEHHPPQKGVRLVLQDVFDWFNNHWSEELDTFLYLPTRIRMLLAACDLPNLEIRLNGDVVKPRFDRKGGSRLAEAAPWGRGTKARIRGYRRSDERGRYYIRLGGLIQFVEAPLTGKLPVDVVIDLTTTLRPGDADYPLNAARDALRGGALDALQALARTVEQEKLSAGATDDAEVWEAKGHNPEAGAEWDKLLDRLTGDHALREMLARELPEEVEGAGEDRTPDAAPPSAGRGGAGKTAGRRGIEGGSEGDTDANEMRPVKARPASPFGTFATLRVSKAHYDPDKARRLRKGWKRWMPHLMAWWMTLRTVARGAQLRLTFRPGFVLDDQVIGLCVTQRGQIPTILIHPDRINDQIAAHAERPLAVAAFLHGVACHELTHAIQDGSGHDEAFVVARENLGHTTAHLLPALARIVEQLLRTKAPPGADTLRLAELEREVAELRKRDPATSPKLQQAVKELAACRARAEAAELESERVRHECAVREARQRLRLAAQQRDPHELLAALEVLLSLSGAADPTYITNFFDRNRGVLLTEVDRALGRTNP